MSTRQEKDQLLIDEISKREEFLSGDQRMARLGDRLIALIIDTLLMASIFVVIGMWSAAKWGGITEIGFFLEGKPALVALSGTILFAFII